MLFLQYHKLRKGQTSAYLIFILAILLMFTVNVIDVGKNSVNKTYTSNAADSCALAGAASMANALNFIQDQSNKMFADYIAAQIMMLLCGVCWKKWVAYALWVASELAMFAFAWVLGNDGVDQGKALGMKLAFSNAGVKGKDTKAFEAFLKSLDDNPNQNTYSWDDVSGGSAYVHVDAQRPADLWLFPLPVIIWFKACQVCKFGCCCCTGCYCGPLPGIGGIAYVGNATDCFTCTVQRKEPYAEMGGYESTKYAIDHPLITSWAKGQVTNDFSIPLGVMPIVGDVYDSELGCTSGDSSAACDCKT